MLLHIVVVLVVVLEEVRIQQLQVVMEIWMEKARLLDILVLHITPLTQVLVVVDGLLVVEAEVARAVRVVRAAQGVEGMVTVAEEDHVRSR